MGVKIVNEITAEVILRLFLYNKKYLGCIYCSMRSDLKYTRRTKIRLCAIIVIRVTVAVAVAKKVLAPAAVEIAFGIAVISVSVVILAEISVCVMRVLAAVLAVVIIVATAVVIPVRKATERALTVIAVTTEDLLALPSAVIQTVLLPPLPTAEICITRVNTVTAMEAVLVARATTTLPRRKPRKSIILRTKKRQSTLSLFSM